MVCKKYWLHINYPEIYIILPDTHNTFSLLQYEIICSRYTVDNGNQIINKETKLALRAGGGASWVLDGDIVALDDNDRIIDMQGRALDRGWNQKDGATPGIYTPHQGPNQKWSVEIVV